MTTVFIAGSISISKIHHFVVERIDNIIQSGLDVVVGDADGADTSIQQVLASRGAQSVTVFCSGSRPRNNVGSWPVNNVFSDAPPKSRAYFTAKDIEMAKCADFGFMIWDSKSTGTLSNVIQLLTEDKKSIVFINKLRKFMKVDNVDTLMELIDHMSPVSRNKAEEKIGLNDKIYNLTNPQSTMSI